MTRWQVRARRPSGHWGVYLVAARSPLLAATHVNDYLYVTHDYALGEFAVEPAPEVEVVGAIDIDEEG